MRPAQIALFVTCAIVCADLPARASEPAGRKHPPAATHAAEKPKDSHAPTAGATAGAKHTPAPSSKDPRAVSAPKSAKPARVDEVMGRVHKIIATYEKECLPEEGMPGGATRAKARPASRAVAKPGTHARVRLIWRVALVWPSEVLG